MIKLNKCWVLSSTDAQHISKKAKQNKNSARTGQKIDVLEVTYTNVEINIHV